MSEVSNFGFTEQNQEAAVEDYQKMLVEHDKNLEDKYMRIQALDFASRGVTPKDDVEEYLDAADAIQLYLATGARSTGNQSL